ncbi:Ribosomal protein S18 acetylase RimI [Actinopolymorpha singaporensis]|uniref:Ribosomal protein S18 acetylase RimI n=1 Tax=Actinopolymorpha singaporensis TaxID=117157 RepID=A0A1H1M0Y7_9ACTN|nr:Ribosomal protein S18 acetylase RimI [Actinopolymorpha singaporensis]
MNDGAWQADAVTTTAERLLVRPARAEDDAALLAVDGASWSSTSGFPSLQGETRTSFFDDHNTPDLHLVAESDSSVAGYVRITTMVPFPEGAHVLGIYGFAVVPAARGQGVGSALLVAAQEYARRRGARKLSLRVFGTNTTARRLYERHGFVVEGVLRAAFLIDGEYVDDVWMSKFLVPVEADTAGTADTTETTETGPAAPGVTPAKARSSS